MKTILKIVLLTSMALQAQPVQTDSTSRADAILKQMTLDEKIGQIIQVDYMAIKDHPEDIVTYAIGSILWGGSSELDDITARGWAAECRALQKVTETTRLKIPLLFGIDAVHGNNNVEGAVIFPHNIGLGATRNPRLIEQIGRVTALEMRGSGLQWDFAPCVAVARDERWGRTYESFSEDPALVQELGAAYIKGMQGSGLADPASVLACAKHFVGDGGTTNGIDQGNTTIDEVALRNIHLAPYRECIKAGVRSIMISYSSWNGKKMHGNKYLLTDVLKQELGFSGFLISDWAAINQLPGSYKEQIEQSINAGLDMIMITKGSRDSTGYIRFYRFLKELVLEKKVPVSRIDDAARRILHVKEEMRLFEQPNSDSSFTRMVGSPEHRAIAREAVRQSLVLLKNDKGILPLAKTIKRIHIAGLGANSIGMQCGGWTISWQGHDTIKVIGGTTVLDAVKKSVSIESKVTYSLDGTNAAGADAGIIVLGEAPYAEENGDRSDLSLSSADRAVLATMKSTGIPLVAILFSGRPLLIDPLLESCSAVLAVWLPGSEGEGITDVLFGDYVPVGKLPCSWPRSMKQLPINVGDTYYNPLFPYGFGLTYQKK